MFHWGVLVVNAFSLSAMATGGSAGCCSALRVSCMLRAAPDRLIEFAYAAAFCGVSYLMG